MNSMTAWMVLTVGPATHGFSKLAAFFIAHVARQRADQPRNHTVFRYAGSARQAGKSGG